MTSNGQIGGIFKYFRKNDNTSSNWLNAIGKILLWAMSVGNDLQIDWVQL